MVPRLSSLEVAPATTWIYICIGTATWTVALGIFVIGKFLFNLSCYFGEKKFQPDGDYGEGCWTITHYPPCRITEIQAIYPCQ